MSYDLLDDWMQKAERVWLENRSTATTIDFAEQLDYYGKLSAQFPIPALRVVYAKAGTQPAASFVRDPRAVIDHKLYWTAPSSEDEGHYLCALLNSEVTRARAEQYQSRGQFGARDFDKVIWNLPIPRFDPNNKLHLTLADSGRRADAATQSVELVEGEKFQRARASGCAMR